MKRPSNRLLWVATQLALGGAGLAAFALNGDVWVGIAVLGLMIAAVVVFEIAYRRELSVAGWLTGIGDERVSGLYRGANARTGEWMAYVLAVWAIVTVAQGKQNDTLMAVVAAYVALWCLNLGRAMLAARGMGRGASA